MEILLVAKPEATEQDILDALEVANAKEFVLDLPTRPAYKYR